MAVEPRAPETLDTHLACTRRPAERKRVLCVRARVLLWKRNASLFCTRSELQRATGVGRGTRLIFVRGPESVLRVRVHRRRVAALTAIVPTRPVHATVPLKSHTVTTAGHGLGKRRRFFRFFRCLFRVIANVVGRFVAMHAKQSVTGG